MGFFRVETDLTLGKWTNIFKVGQVMQRALQTTAAMEAPQVEGVCADPVPGTRHQKGV